MVIFHTYVSLPEGAHSDGNIEGQGMQKLCGQMMQKQWKMSIRKYPCV